MARGGAALLVQTDGLERLNHPSKNISAVQVKGKGTAVDTNRDVWGELMYGSTFS